MAADSPFFANQPWYVASCNGGSSSAQTFTAGGYTFLHIGLEFAPTDAVLAWATDVAREYRDFPTIVTVHDFINASGDRLPNPSVDMRAIDPGRNNPQDVWEKFISRNSQVFLVLCGHQPGQAHRIDYNQAGGKVHQLLANYQHRSRAAIEAGSRARYPATGDGWFRLMTFDLAASEPAVRVRTYSHHYGLYASEHPHYAQWYRQEEQPSLSDEEFLRAEEFQVCLDDFRKRFGV